MNLNHELRLAGGRLILAAVVAWAVIALCVSASFLWTPRGTFGLLANYDGVVTAVFAGSPADRAGIARGDRIDLAATPFASRPLVVGVPAMFPPGARATLRVARAGAERSLTLVSTTLPQTRADRLSFLIDLAATAIFVVVGAALIFLRPSVVTWGFGLYCLLTVPVVPALARFPSATAHLAYVGVYDVLQNLGLTGLVLFALNFPQPLDRRWRRALKGVLPLVFPILAAWTLWIDLSVCVFARPAHVANLWLQGVFAVVDLIAILSITETYVAGPVENRPRLRWVLVGFYVGLVCNYVGSFLVYTANVALPFWLDTLLISCVVTLPVAVGYAVVRHRVIEIDFFLSRAIVYALFTSGLVVIFGAADWLFSRILADFRLSLLFDALVSIGAAFTIDAIRKRLERFVDEFLFRGRRVARERLERLGRALRHTTSAQSVDSALVEEPHAALNLASIALFRRDGRAYRRVAAAGWPGGSRESLEKDDRLALEHRATGGTIHIGDFAWNADRLPAGLARPTLSIPLLSSRELTGLLMCSGTVHGEQLDPEELLWVEQLANAGAGAYEELETERLRKTAARLRREVAVLGARLEEAHRASAPG